MHVQALTGLLFLFLGFFGSRIRTGTSTSSAASSRGSSSAT